MQEGKGMTDDEVVGWQHQLSAPGFEQTLGNSEGQGRLAHGVANSQIGLSG